MGVHGCFPVEVYRVILEHLTGYMLFLCNDYERHLFQADIETIRKSSDAFYVKSVLNSGLQTDIEAFGCRFL